MDRAMRKDTVLNSSLFNHNLCPVHGVLFDTEAKHKDSFALHLQTTFIQLRNLSEYY